MEVRHLPMTAQNLFCIINVLCYIILCFQDPLGLTSIKFLSVVALEKNATIMAIDKCILNNDSPAYSGWAASIRRDGPGFQLVFPLDMSPDSPSLRHIFLLNALSSFFHFFPPLPCSASLVAQGKSYLLIDRKTMNILCSSFPGELAHCSHLLLIIPDF